MLNAYFLFFINVVVGPSLSRIRHLRPEMVAVTIETCSPSLQGREIKLIRGKQRRIHGYSSRVRVGRNSGRK